jgi:hypothetical protein
MFSPARDLAASHGYTVLPVTYRLFRSGTGRKAPVTACLCDRLIDLLMPVRRESGPVINLKKPEDETERLARMTGIQWRRNALRHSFCSYRVPIARTLVDTSAALAVAHAGLLAD